MSYGQLQTKASLNHTAINVTNLKKSVDFYNDIIGLQNIPEPFKDGKHAWFKTGEKTSLHIIEGATETKEYYKSNHTCYSVSSVTDFVAKLKLNNIQWEDAKGQAAAITIRVDGVKQVYFKDPDGYWIEINDAKE